MAYMSAGTRCWLKKEGFDLAKIDKRGGTPGKAWARRRDNPEEAEQ